MHLPPLLSAGMKWFVLNGENIAQIVCVDFLHFARFRCKFPQNPWFAFSGNFFHVSSLTALLYYKMRYIWQSYPRRPIKVGCRIPGLAVKAHGSVLMPGRTVSGGPGTVASVRRAQVWAVRRGRRRHLANRYPDLVVVVVIIVSGVRHVDHVDGRSSVTARASRSATSHHVFSSLTFNVASYTLRSPGKKGQGFKGTSWQMRCKNLTCYFHKSRHNSLQGRNIKNFFFIMKISYTSSFAIKKAGVTLTTN